MDGESLRHAIAALADLMVHGRIKAPAFRTMPLADAAQAHALMEQGGLRGRLLLVP
jgi:NADPH:quinone reductase-like Zn-dependent oxidoreductase